MPCKVCARPLFAAERRGNICASCARSGYLRVMRLLDFTGWNLQAQMLAHVAAMKATMERANAS